MTVLPLSPRFLTYEQVLSLHDLQIKNFGGLPGVKNEALLRSALGQPESGFGDDYLHSDLYQMAAAYLFHLLLNHAFHDGNKRIATLCAVVFLELNGLEVVAPEDMFEKFVLLAASGKKDKPQIASFFKKHCRPLESESDP